MGCGEYFWEPPPQFPLHYNVTLFIKTLPTNHIKLVLPLLCYSSFGFLVFSFIRCIMSYNYIFIYTFTFFHFQHKLQQFRELNFNGLYLLTSVIHSAWLVERATRDSV